MLIVLNEYITETGDCRIQAIDPSQIQILKQDADQPSFWTEVRTISGACFEVACSIEQIVRRLNAASVFGYWLQNIRQLGRAWVPHARVSGLDQLSEKFVRVFIDGLQPCHWLLENNDDVGDLIGT